MLFSPTKETNPDTCDTLDESEGHYFKWIKPAIERQTSNSLIKMQNEKKSRTDQE